MSVLTVKPTFVYPTSRQFPFDEVVEKIVRALEKRNWQVPNINVKFRTWGSGEAKYQRVHYITGNDFKLYFGRMQGNLNERYMDTSALCCAYIPQQGLKVYVDEGGPIYYLYVGNNWNQDKEWFMNSIKVHSKSNNQPRKYLRYTGERHYEKRAVELVADNDFGREYSPEENEPIRINLEEKFKEFTLWLEKYVLKYILTFPEAEVIQSSISPIELIPYNGPFETLYSICSDSDAKRILQGKTDISQLTPFDRHARFGRGTRLIPLSVECNESFPKIANEGFIWCDINPPKNSLLSMAVRFAMEPLFSKDYHVTIKLKYANNVYIVDNYELEKRQQELFKAIAPRDKLTNNELDIIIVARGKTIIPITEYKGNFKQPIVLINRELDFDEIETVTAR